MIRLLVVHQIPLVGDLVVTTLQDEADISKANYARTLDDALARCDKHTYDVVLVDINLPDSGALQLVQHMRKSPNGPKVLITGLVRSKAAVLSCIEEGAAGYVLEEESLEDLLHKIRAVHRNEFPVAPPMAMALVSRLAELKRLSVNSCEFTSRMRQEAQDELTPREREVLRLIEQGMSNQEIADTLVIELGTVKNHVHNILSKLDVSNRAQAALFARQLLAECSIK